MYQSFYGLTARPFGLAPDPMYFLPFAVHRDALSYLRCGIARDEGIVLLTGAAGTGKTLLAQMLVGELGHTCDCVQLAMTDLSPADMLRWLLRALRPEERLPATRAALLHRLQQHLKARRAGGTRTVFLIDEAHCMPRDTLQELSVLSSIEAGSPQALQVVLVGQEPLRKRLAGGEMEALRRRVTCAYQLRPLTAAETREYIRHRLRRAQWRGRPAWDESLYALIHDHAAGIPRRINLACDRLLLYGVLEGLNELGIAELNVVLAELRREFAADAPHASAGRVRPAELPMLEAVAP